MPRIPQAERVDPRFPERWSPRAFDPRPVDAQDLAALFEAARWAPSASNEQPWRFVYADGGPGLDALRQVVNDSNRRWAGKAPVLCVVFARRTFEKSGKDNRWAPFDAGAAWQSLALQARSLGLVTHAMGGFSVQAAHDACGIAPEEAEAICVIAIGPPGRVEELPEDLAAREAPSGRRPVEEWLQRL